ncbi:tRNA lysidine(34) synthetase TilS [Iodobacter sp.]|uniref:tRNA lysidine(34) synthetase TilS n=1 Tax=Iodobacter sp. TaxID=1915058 RepID=UPI0025D4FF2F|nr:tRNA lysidine(34) synthetase TilS [Iodobacter sp.]
MASLRKSLFPDALSLRVEQILERRLFSMSPPDKPTLCVGLSGGLDSVVLLHLLAGLCQQRFVLRAIHVHHGLSANADAWAQFAQALCSRLDVECAVERVSLLPYAGMGVEGAARAARYGAFERQVCDVLLLAQHKNDQAETVLLNLLRGSGLRGLAAMPEWRMQNTQMGILRPLLDFTRQDLADYAKQYGLEWIEDESNQDSRYDRNFLRNQIIPQLETVWPSASATLARVAQHAAEADDLLQELAAGDLEHAVQGDAFDLRVALSPLRLRNVLRYWLTRHGLQLDTRAFEELLRVAFAAGEDAQPALHWRDRAIRRYQHRLFITSSQILIGQALALPWVMQSKVDAWHGVLSWQASEQGIAAKRLNQAVLELRPRLGGESLRLVKDGPSRALKQLYQEAKMPPWQRQSNPLIYLDGVLAAVPGLGVASVFRAEGEAGFMPLWRLL